MGFVASVSDRRFQQQFEAGAVSPAEFDHRGHLRLAYTYLCDDSVTGAIRRARRFIQQFLATHSIDTSNYHETLTVAWLGAVRYLMERAGSTDSFDEFLKTGACLLDPKIMLTHYSEDRLFSPAARAGYVPPDIDPIPTLVVD